MKRTTMIFSLFCLPMMVMAESSAETTQQNYLNLLVDILKQPPAKIQQYAEQSLLDAGEPAIPVLLKRLQQQPDLPLNQTLRVELRRAMAQSF